MTPKEVSEVDRIIESLIDAVKNGTVTQGDPCELEYTKKALDAIADARKFQKAVRLVASLKRAG